jgi:hypothetical protein
VLKVTWYFFTKGVAKNVQKMDPPCWQSMFSVCDGTKPQVCVSSGSAVTFMLQMPPTPNLPKPAIELVEKLLLRNKNSLAELNLPVHFRESHLT